VLYAPTITALSFLVTVVLPPRDLPVLAAEAPIEKVRVPEDNVSVDAEI
jgi:hypothetical protein